MKYRMGNTALTKLISAGAIVVGVAGFFATMNSSVDLFKPKTFHEAAKKWCKGNDGEFWDGKIAYMAKQPECKVPRYKGKAGIFDGYDEYEFSYQIKDYDTGLTEVYAEPKQSIIFRLGTEEERRQYKEYLAARTKPVITFITKGKNN